MADSISVPQMQFGPADTIKQLSQIVEAQHENSVVLIGSSLGGYYATYLANQYDLPAALVNPAVRPFELWQDHLGEHKNYYSDEIHVVTKTHIEELRQLDTPQLANPQDLLVLLQTGDETLDYRRALEKYGPSRCIVRENGNHSYENYSFELPAIFDFLISRIS